MLGIIVSRFGIQGPEPVAQFPMHYDTPTLAHIAMKSVSILAGEDGELPPSENLSVLPLPKLRATAVIFVFEIPKPEVRGKLQTATVSILFKEKYTAIIYKMMEELANSIKSMNTLIENLQKDEDITNQVASLYENIENNLEIWRKDEVARYNIALSPEKDYKHIYNYKIIAIGDPKVGKTTLILRYVDSAFRELYIPTMGAQISKKNLEYKTPEGCSLVKMNLWDIAGQTLFKRVRNKFYQEADAVLILYDTTDLKTVESVEQWYSDMIKVTGKINGFVIGNKIDLPRQFSGKDGEKLANRLGLGFMETSAKTGEGVEKLFHDLAEMLVKGTRK